MSTHLEIHGLCKSYGGNVVTRSLDMVVPAGSLSAIIGPNGAGKTTLLNLITGLIAPDAGSIRIGGQEIAGRSAPQIVEAGVGRAFQTANLFPTFTVEATLVACAAARRGKLWKPFGRYPTSDAVAKANQLVEQVGLEHVRYRICSTLSHGDQKLLDIAIALAREPRVLLLDEPMAGMGPGERQTMVACLKRLWSEGGMTLLFVEHDMDVVFGTAKHVIVMQMGTKISEGSPSEIRNDPRVIEAYLGSGHA